MTAPFWFGVMCGIGIVFASAAFSLLLAQIIALDKRDEDRASIDEFTEARNNARWQ